jgi:thiol-disulfide isomerase/thioredoxin
MGGKPYVSPDMTDAPATPPSDPQVVLPRWLGLALRGMVLVAVGGLAWVLFQAATNMQPAGGLKAFQRGTLTALEIIPDPPAQPTQSFAGPDGAPASLLDYRGKVVLVNFWATDCAVCVKAMPQISVDQEDAGAEAKAKLAELTGGALPFYHDPRMTTVYPARARGFPTSILYDRNGRELARLAGEADWDDAVAMGLIGHAVALPAGPGS